MKKERRHLLLLLIAGLIGAGLFAVFALRAAEHDPQPAASRADEPDILGGVTGSSRDEEELKALIASMERRAERERMRSRKWEAPTLRILRVEDPTWVPSAEGEDGTGAVHVRVHFEIQYVEAPASSIGIVVSLLSSGIRSEAMLKKEDYESLRIDSEVSTVLEFPLEKPEQAWLRDVTAGEVHWKARVSVMWTRYESGAFDRYNRADNE